jgi:hypothetical protein
MCDGKCHRAFATLPALQTLFLEEVPPSGPVQEAVLPHESLLVTPLLFFHWERE